MSEIRQMIEARSARTCLMVGPPSSLGFQLHVLVGRGERPARDEAEARLGHAGTGRVDEAELPDRRVHGPLVDDLLDPVEHRLAPAAIELAGLLSEESVDLGIAAVDVGPAGGDEGLETDRCVAKRAAD